MDDGVRRKEKAYLTGQIRLYEYASALRRCQPSQPLSQLVPLGESFISAAAGFYQLARSFMTLSDTTAFVLEDEESAFSVQFDGHTLKNPDLSCGISLEFPDHLVLGISWTPREGYSPTSVLDEMSRSFTRYVPLTGQPDRIRSELPPDIIPLISVNDVYRLAEGPALLERLSTYERS
ncbi:MAG TPA: hypothetical protein VJH22_00465, partial [Candidatus Nanoarchaeia archaeon]|nr:hypothetical protein [Candidatus Nanoarchaeia archaeon]